jgi:Ca2+-dependent lipid-binding protein
MFQEMQTSDFEKMVWLRILLNKAWPTYANYMITTTRVQTAKAVEEMFAKNKPPGVDNVVLDHVDFGTIAPDILSMKGYTSYETRDGKHVDDNTHFQVDTNVAYAALARSKFLTWSFRR